MEFVDTSIVEQIEMKMILPSQFAVRDKLQKMTAETETLAASIREHGLLQPILIRPLDHGFEVVAGHRRFQACRSLRWRFISCKIRELSDKQAFEIQLTENLQRKSMDTIEEAEAFRRYIIDFGWGGVSELARKIGKSEEFVSHRLQLLKLPEAIKQQIALNKINVSQAIELSTIPSSRQSEMLLHQIVNDNLTVKEIREVKSTLMKELENHANDSYDLGCSPAIAHTPGPIKIARKTTLALKITLSRLDNLIEEVHTTVPSDQRAKIISMLMAMRLRVHAMIDESIQFKISKSKQSDHKLLSSA